MLSGNNAFSKVLSEASKISHKDIHNMTRILTHINKSNDHSNKTKHRGYKY